jgi:hypothetical protein
MADTLQPGMTFEFRIDADKFNAAVAKKQATR